MMNSFCHCHCEKTSAKRMQLPLLHLLMQLLHRFIADGRKKVREALTLLPFPSFAALESIAEKIKGSLRAYYRHFYATTGQSATEEDFGTFLPCSSLSAFPLTFPVFCFPRSAYEPVSLSCHLYAACHNAIDRLLHCLSSVLSDTDF